MKLIVLVLSSSFFFNNCKTCKYIYASRDRVLRERLRKWFWNCCVFHFIACGGNLSGTTGEINVMSKDYSGYCYWEMQSPLMNSSILLVIEHFQLRSCWWEHLITSLLWLSYFYALGLVIDYRDMNPNYPVSLLRHSVILCYLSLTWQNVTLKLKT